MTRFRRAIAGSGPGGRLTRKDVLDAAAKQKLRSYYGNISEKQFRAAYAEALRVKGDSSENLIGLLERRIDALVYRAKWVSTVFAARQLVSHGHVKLNGKRVTIASIRLKVGDVVERLLPRADLPIDLRITQAKRAAVRMRQMNSS